MRLVWDEHAWADYLRWQTQDRKTLKRINALIRDIARGLAVETKGTGQAVDDDDGNSGQQNKYLSYDVFHL